MKFDDRYEMRVVIVEEINGMSGDCYADFEKFKKEKPDASYRFGFVVIDTETGFIPDNCNDWNDSPEEAVFDYYDNCVDQGVKNGTI